MSIQGTKIPLMGLRGLTAVAVAALAAQLSGCGGDTAPASPTPSSTPPSSPTAAADPAQVLTAAGLSLPGSATNVAIKELPKSPFTNRYLVTFTAPVAQAEALCTAAGLGGQIVPSPSLTAEEQSVLGMTTAPAGSHGCSGSNPSDLRSQRTILYAGDPARVWIGVWRMPPR